MAEIIRRTAPPGMDQQAPRQAPESRPAGHPGPAHQQRPGGLPAPCPGPRIAHDGLQPHTSKAAAAATQAVLDAVNSGQLTWAQLEGCAFWADQAAEQRPQAQAPRHPGPAGQAAWAGRGFTRPGPGAEPPRELYLAALQDALAYTSDRDGCAECDGAARCEAHAARAVRAGYYQRALDQELEAGS